ncbi:MAG: response regulator [Thermomicrobiales bacterium]|nr:response regulator [Thermomicrobiales bacterium]
MRAAILVVDDEPSIASALAIVFSDEGHVVHTARDGAEAVALLTRQSVDLIVSDVMMPTIDGLTLVRHLRRRGDRTPVVLMSAAPSRVAPIPGVRLVSKPFDIDEMLDVVAMALAEP